MDRWTQSGETYRLDGFVSRIQDITCGLFQDSRATRATERPGPKKRKNLRGQLHSAHLGLYFMPGARRQVAGSDRRGEGAVQTGGRRAQPGCGCCRRRGGCGRGGGWRRRGRCGDRQAGRQGGTNIQLVRQCAGRNDAWVIVLAFSHCAAMTDEHEGSAARTRIEGVPRRQSKLRKANCRINVATCMFVVWLDTVWCG
jgi:hypothetical protein